MEIERTVKARIKIHNADHDYRNDLSDIQKRWDTLCSKSTFKRTFYR
jgi:hypothetical protein